MARYLVSRLARLLIVIWGVSTLMFAILAFSSEPISLFVPIDATAEQVELAREAYGFNDPLPVRYLAYLERTLTGDLGTSFRFGVPVSSLVLERLPATLQLALAGMGIGLLFGIPAGIIAAVKRGTVLDSVVMVAAVIVQGMPIFWLGILLIILFAVQLNWFPATGEGTWRHLVLPALSLGLLYMAQFARLTRSSFLEVLHQDYVRTARSKGLRESTILFRHVLKNASIPLVSLFAVNISTLFGGAIVAETVFTWPGLGRILARAVLDGDYPLVQGSILVIAILVALVSFLSDLMYGYLDPRMRAAARGGR